MFVALGLSDKHGRMKPSRQGKYRQVEEFLRILDASIADAIDKGHLRRPTTDVWLLGSTNGGVSFGAPRRVASISRFDSDLFTGGTGGVSGPSQPVPSQRRRAPPE